MRIHATRSSVCLGDDFAGPEERDLVLDEQARLSELMKQLAGYVPYFGNVVWSIRCGDKVIGYLYSPGEKAAYRYKLTAGNKRVSELGDETVFCRYYSGKDIRIRNIKVFSLPGTIYLKKVMLYEEQMRKEGMLF